VSHLARFSSSRARAHPWRCVAQFSIAFRVKFIPVPHASRSLALERTSVASTTDNMTTDMPLAVTQPTPIAQLNPELPNFESSIVEGEVTITWPFSVVTRSIAFKLVERDFRLRRDRGQVRIEFHGPAAKAIAKANIGGGDEVRLSLLGAQWERPAQQTPVRPDTLEWQLKFTRRVYMKVTRVESREEDVINIDASDIDDEPPVDLSSQIATPLATRSTSPGYSLTLPESPIAALPTKRPASSALEPEEFASPAFIKKARISYGSLFEGDMDIFEDARKKKSTRRRSRFSMNANWKYSSRSPSPEPQRQYDEDEDDSDDSSEALGKTAQARDASGPPSSTSPMVDEACQTKDLETLPQSPSEMPQVYRSDTNAVPSSPSPLISKNVESSGGASMQQLLASSPIHRDQVDQIIRDAQEMPDERLGFFDAPHGQDTMGPTMTSLQPAPFFMGNTSNPELGGPVMGMAPEPAAAMSGFSVMREEPIAVNEQDIMPRNTEFYASVGLHTVSEGHDSRISHQDTYPPIPEELPHNYLSFGSGHTEHPAWHGTSTTSIYPPPMPPQNSAGNPVEILDSSSPVREPSPEDNDVSSISRDAREQSTDRMGSGALDSGAVNSGVVPSSPVSSAESPQRENTDDYVDGGDIQGEDYDLRNYDDAKDDDLEESEEEIVQLGEPGDQVIDERSDESEDEEVEDEVEVVDIDEEQREEHEVGEEEYDTQEDDQEQGEGEDNEGDEEVDVDDIVNGESSVEEDEAEDPVTHDEGGEAHLGWSTVNRSKHFTASNTGSQVVEEDSEVGDEELEDAEMADEEADDEDLDEEDEEEENVDDDDMDDEELEYPEADSDDEQVTSHKPPAPSAAVFISLLSDSEDDDTQDQGQHVEQAVPIPQHSTSEDDDVDAQHDEEASQADTELQDDNRTPDESDDSDAGPATEEVETVDLEAVGPRTVEFETVEVEIAMPEPVEDETVEVEAEIEETSVASAAAEPEQVVEVQNIAEEASSAVRSSQNDSIEPHGDGADMSAINQASPARRSHTGTPRLTSHNLAGEATQDSSGYDLERPQSQPTTPEDLATVSQAGNDSMPQGQQNQPPAVANSQGEKSIHSGEELIVEKPAQNLGEADIESALQKSSEERQGIVQDLTTSDNAIVSSGAIAIPDPTREDSPAAEIPTAEKRGSSLLQIDATAPSIESFASEAEQVREAVATSPPATQPALLQPPAKPSPALLTEKEMVVDTQHDEPQLPTPGETQHDDAMDTRSDHDSDELGEEEYSFAAEQQIMQESQEYEASFHEPTVAPPARKTPEVARQQVNKLDAPQEGSIRAKPERDILITVQSLRSWDQRKSMSSDATGDDMQDPSIALARAPADASAREEEDREEGSTRTIQAIGKRDDTGDPSIQLARAPQTPTRKRTRREVTPQTTTTDAQGTPRTRRQSKTPDSAAEALRTPSIAGSAAAEDEHVSSLKLRLSRDLRTKLADYSSLNTLRGALAKVVDLMVVATLTPTPPSRPKNGPRDYMLELILTDPSTAPSGVTVAHIFRPHQASLPIVHAGDVVLLRQFHVVSMKGRGFGVRAGDGSSWAVFDKAAAHAHDMLPQIRGPPVELSDDEVEHAAGLKRWWTLLDGRAKGKLDKATHKVTQAGVDGKQ
jgi:hypothetical protein